ncbi:MAG: hypothetical protein BWK75_03455 [Candidatus Altiarchaeales archaeon A3]|nr:MAG: hypothetical protein BWK75_03455 [Candidatus Altiarchaeales archaeon A3]
MSAILKTENLKKDFLMGKIKVPALRGVNIEIEQGSFTAVMGASGSGKTTLLNMVGLLDAPSSGKVYVDGIDTSDLSGTQMAKMRLEKLGFIFQFFNLFLELTALENVMVPLMLAGRGDAEKRAKELLELVGLGDRLDHKPSELSGGQQQRVTIARALVNEPVLLLADEPTANLDSKTAVEVVGLFRKLNKETGVTVFMVTHEEELGRMADRIIWLRDGLIKNIGNIDKIN